jgi:hypothetical protein
MPLESVELFVLFCNATCVTLSEEWVTMPCPRWSDQRQGAPEPRTLGKLARTQKLANARSVGGYQAGR